MELNYIVNCYLFLLIQLIFVTARTVKHVSTCKILLDKLTCSGCMTEFNGNANNVTQLKLYNLTTKAFNFDCILGKYPNLEYVSIENSEISSIKYPKTDNAIKELILRDVGIKSISQNFVRSFPSLKILKLERNFLSNVSLDFYVGTLEELHIRNNRWKCSEDLSWALHLNATGIARDITNITCKDKLYAKKSVLLIAEFKKNMKEKCTKSCDCSLVYIVDDPKTNQPSPIIMVNCSGRGFTELPEQLPPYTRILHLENNGISNLNALRNRSYLQLYDLYMDNNSIESISYLEGSHWLSHFRIFSLRGNKLRTLPSYALDNALMKNPNMPSAVTLFFGGNPWKCDCTFTPVFQDYVLQKYSIQIRDIEDVKCSYVRGDENSLKPINTLSRSSVCMASTDFSLQDGLDLLNAVLGSLIIFILGKLAYDYYHFKKSGKLPWIVSKIP